MTDENDPYFLYVLDVGEQDFHHLKRDQSLLVEFLVFPSKLIELIELCLNSNENHTESLSNTSNSQNSSEYSSSIFTANLDMTGGALTIVELNKFKQLTHISLQLRLGNDAAIKGYLSSRLIFITTMANKRKVELAITQTELKDEKQQRSELSKALDELRYVQYSTLHYAATYRYASIEYCVIWVCICFPFVTAVASINRHKHTHESDNFRILEELNLSILHYLLACYLDKMFLISLSVKTLSELNILQQHTVLIVVGLNIGLATFSRLLIRK